MTLNETMDLVVRMVHSPSWKADLKWAGFEVSKVDTCVVHSGVSVVIRSLGAEREFGVRLEATYAIGPMDFEDADVEELRRRLAQRQEDALSLIVGRGKLIRSTKHMRVHAVHP